MKINIYTPSKLYFYFELIIRKKIYFIYIKLSSIYKKKNSK